jgi:site-specific DNA recombinase
MLSNEKYKGYALLQKAYIVDFLSKKRVENNGEIPQYYMEESHPGRQALINLAKCKIRLP